MENSQSSPNILVRSIYPKSITGFIIDKPIVSGKKDRNGKVTYIPQPQHFTKARPQIRKDLFFFEEKYLD